MTVPSTARYAGPYFGDGSLVSFPFVFKVFAAEDVAIALTNADGVEQTGLTLDSDFLVTLNADQETTPGGSVQYAVAGVATPLPADWTLAITGEGLPFDQPTDLPSGGNFRAEEVEASLDRLEMQIQNLRAGLARALLIRPTSYAGGAALTLPAPEDQTVLGWEGTTLRNYPRGSAILLADNEDSSDPALIDWFLKVPSLILKPYMGETATGVNGTGAGRATRVGDITQVELSFALTEASPALGGAFRLAGLPFAAQTETPLIVEVGGTTSLPATTEFRAHTIPGTKALKLSRYDADASGYLPVTEYDIGVGTTLKVAGTYACDSSEGLAIARAPAPPIYWKQTDVSSLTVSDFIYKVAYVNAPDFTGWIATTRTTGRILRSTDLLTWESFTPAPWDSASGYVYDLGYAGGFWVARVAFTIQVAASLAGPWVRVGQVGGPAFSDFSAVVPINNRWYALGTNGAIYKAPLDARDPWVWKWTSGPGSSAYMRGIAAKGTTIVAFGSGSWSAKSTDDGETFANNTVTGLPFTAIVNQALICDGNEFLMANGGYIAASSDGTTWTTRVDAVTAGQPYYNWFASVQQVVQVNGYSILQRASSNRNFIYSTDGFRTLKRDDMQPFVTGDLIEYPITFGNGYYVIGATGSSTRRIFWAPATL